MKKGHLEVKQNYKSYVSYRIVGASMSGPLHIAKAIPCQDACAYKIFPNGLGIIAVSDGLGSAFLSDFGARDAVNGVIFSVRRIIDRSTNEDISIVDLANEAVFATRKILEKKSEEYRCNLKDLACTLIVVVVYGNRVSVAHIGDGAVVAKTADGLRILSDPGDSEYANEVVPLTCDEWEKCLRLSSVFSGVLGVMVFTDGLQRAALKKTESGFIPFKRFCDPLFGYVKEVSNEAKAIEDFKNLLLSKKLCANSEDDKTLVICTII